MKSLDFRYLIRNSFILLIAVFPIWMAAKNPDQPSEKEGALHVQVISDDINNSPAEDVYVEAYGFVHKSYANKSFVLKGSKGGQYDASMPPVTMMSL
ncbi:MAG: hypothetical protein ACJ71N_06160 [Terriglobales bacterium]